MNGSSPNLEYSSDSDPGFSRRRCGRGFTYFDQHGERITRPETRNRIAGLAIPPAYTGVWICPKPTGHLQATGRDDRSRKQYRYHPEWLEYRNRLKFEELVDFAGALPRIRRRVMDDIDDEKLTKRRVLAAAIRIMDHTGARVGNEAYLEENGTYGVTTLNKKHFTETDDEFGRFTLRYEGKGRCEVALELTSERLTRILYQCSELPGQRLFQYQVADEEFRTVHSTDVNEYLAEFGDHISAKAFRTWKATLLCFARLANREPPSSKAARVREVNEALGAVAERLYHRPATCRKFYVHPKVLQSFTEGVRLEGAVCDTTRRSPKQGHSAMESALVDFLERGG